MTDEIIGRNLIELNIVDSTNEYLKRLIKESDVEEGTVILADFQTKGKGQKDGYWESEKGKNLTFSIILYPTSLDVQKQFYLSMSISLGIIEFLSHLSVKSKIKWPNDIYVNNNKVAGILIENSISEDLNSALLEWEYQFSFVKPSHCVCGQKIKENCVIENLHNLNKLIVGNVCVKKFFERDYSFIFKGITSIKKNKIPNKTFINYCYDKGYLYENQKDFLLKIHRKRNISILQEQFKNKILYKLSKINEF